MLSINCDSGVALMVQQLMTCQCPPRNAKISRPVSIGQLPKTLMLPIVYSYCQMYNSKWNTSILAGLHNFGYGLLSKEILCT